MINVTKTYLPPFEEYTKLLKRAWDKAWITNNGELVLELEQKLRETTGTGYLWYCSNGTIVLQMALKALGITKKVITTPFSYVATTNAILWEGCIPVFVDIDPLTLTLDSTKIEEAITSDTEAILATHVYGYPCDVEQIELIASKYNLKVIYDAAHSFGCNYKGRSLLNYGDVSTCSFHATKIFHTVEGGAVVSKSKDIAEKLYLLRSFGHINDDHYCAGINGKNSEFHAAMGLAMLPHLEDIIAKRKAIVVLYDKLLNGIVRRLSVPDHFGYNYAYYPVIFESEAELLLVKAMLEKLQINTRRYFYPSLNCLPHTTKFEYSCPVSEDISKRVLCLPLFADLNESEATFIGNSVIKALKGHKVTV